MNLDDVYIRVGFIISGVRAFTTRLRRQRSSRRFQLCRSRVAVFNGFNCRWRRRVRKSAMSTLDIKEILFRIFILEDFK